MKGDGQAFLDALPQNTQLVVETLTPTANSNGPNQVILITGNAQVAGTTQAIVLDTTHLPSGSHLEVNNIGFMAVVGAARITGGAGQNIAVGDNEDQFIVLGAEDDLLHGGGGNDTVGSKGGNDQLFGDAGNDTVVGGLGNDTLDGGAGNDILQGGQSDAGDYTVKINTNGQVTTLYTPTDTEIADMTTTGFYTHLGEWRSNDDRGAYSTQTADHLTSTALLYRAVLGNLPTLKELNTYSSNGLNDNQLAQLAYTHYLNTHPGIQQQSLTAQVKALVESVWGVNSSSEALIPVGVDYISKGGSWAEGLLALVRSSTNTRAVADSNGNLTLTQTYHSSEMGWSSDTGNDTLLGGEGNDVLAGGRGNNLVDGGNGVDMVVLLGAVKDYTFHVNLTNSGAQLVLTEVYGASINTLTAIEGLKVGSHYYALGNLATVSSGEHALAELLTEVSVDLVQTVGLPGEVGVY